VNGDDGDLSYRTLVEAYTTDGHPCTIIVDRVDMRGRAAIGVLVSWQGTDRSTTVVDRSHANELADAIRRAA